MLLSLFIEQQNMWAADCSYIRRLLPPRHFGTIRKAMVEELYAQNKTFPCLPANGTIADNYKAFLLGRFMNEYWVWAHPNVRPCDGFPKELDFFRAPLNFTPTLSFPSNTIKKRMAEDLFVKYELELLYGKGKPDTKRICDTSKERSPYHPGSSGLIVSFLEEAQASHHIEAADRMIASLKKVK